MAAVAARVTMKDIAKVCGYTVNTVSRAMRNDEQLPAATREKIKAAAEKLGYIPNTLASSLRSGRRNMIAIIINDVRNLHFCRLLSKLDAELRSVHYNVMILCMKSDGELGEQMIHTAISQSVDGMIYFPNLGDREKIEYIRRHGIPFVLMDRYAEGVRADTVRCDDEEGGYLAMRHLLSLGHRRILFLSGRDFSSSQQDRLKGARRALTEQGISPEALRVIPGEKVEKALDSEAMADLLFPTDCTAIISFRDEVSFFVLQALAARNYRVPQDVSVVSFDHLRAEFSYLPKLTSVYAEENTAAEQAVSLLMSRIDQNASPEREVILPVRLFDEGSTAPPRKTPESLA